MNRPKLTRCLFIVLFLACCGCTGSQVQTGLDAGHGPAIDQWLAQAMPEIAQRLKSDSFIKDRPFIIAKPDGAQVSDQIDELTEDIRTRLTDYLLEHREIHLVLRHPVVPMERNYTLRDLRCGAFEDFDMILTIDIRRIGKQIARASIRMLDPAKGMWIRGFSMHADALGLRPEQDLALMTIKPDQHLQGLREWAFTSDERDKLAANLARNLSCIFKDGYFGDDMQVYVDSGRAVGNPIVIKMLLNQLNLCNEIQLVKTRSEADWVVTTEALPTGADGNLVQFWVRTERRREGTLVKGLTTYAYYRQDGMPRRWEILRLSDRKSVGVLEMNEDSKGRITGNVYGYQGNRLIKKGIIINRRDRNIDFAYFDDRHRHTVEVSGVIRDDMQTISATAEFFPTGSGPEDWELRRAE
jgi:hypothetical protein